MDSAYYRNCLYVLIGCERVFMRHPEGRLVAIQQQIFLAGLLADELGMDQAVILRKLGMAGLHLAPDTQEIAVDASVVYPKVADYKSPLRIVPKAEDK